MPQCPIAGDVTVGLATGTVADPEGIAGEGWGEEESSRRQNAECVEGVGRRLENLAENAFQCSPSVTKCL